MSFDLPTPSVSIPSASIEPSNLEPVDSPQALSAPAAPAPAAEHLSLKTGEAVHEGIAAPVNLSLTVAESTVGLDQAMDQAESSLPNLSSSLHTLREAIASPPDEPTAHDVSQLQAHLTHASDQARQALHSLAQVRAHTQASPTAPSSAHHPESISSQLVEEGENLARMAATGMSSRVAEMGTMHASSRTIESLDTKQSARAGAELIAAGAALVQAGYRLHGLRTKLASLKKELKELLQAEGRDHQAPSSLSERLKEGVHQLLQKEGAVTSAPAVINPKITILEKEIEKISHQLKEAAATTATSSVMTAAGGAHFGLDVTEVAAREAMTHAATIATPALALVTGPILIGLAGKKLYEGVKEHQRLSKELEQAQSDQERTQIKEKMTGAKVGITRSGLSIAAATLGIASSAMAVAAAAGVAGLGIAISATGFGALAIGLLALAIGIGYLIYKNRAAIALFLSKLTQFTHIGDSAQELEKRVPSSLANGYQQCVSELDAALNASILKHTGKPKSPELEQSETRLKRAKSLLAQVRLLEQDSAKAARELEARQETRARASTT